MAFPECRLRIEIGQKIIEVPYWPAQALLGLLKIDPSQLKQAHQANWFHPKVIKASARLSGFKEMTAVLHRVYPGLYLSPTSYPLNLLEEILDQLEDVLRPLSATSTAVLLTLPGPPGASLLAERDAAEAHVSKEETRPVSETTPEGPLPALPSHARPPNSPEAGQTPESGSEGPGEGRNAP